MCSQNSISTPDTRKPSGWRKVSANLAAAEQFARVGERLAVPKSEAFVAVKRVGAHIGLKVGDAMLLDTLGAFTQPQDWEKGRRPIVWVSNAYLTEQTGLSLSALKRHIRRLAEAGLIAFQDSPNGKRWGRRDHHGYIIEAYGFDLSPLAARVEEFNALYQHIKVERAHCQRLKRQITVARRMIRAQIEAAFQDNLSGDWLTYLERFEELLGRLPRANASYESLEQVFGLFNTLQELVEQSYAEAVHVTNSGENIGKTEGQIVQTTPEMDPKGVSSDPHIPTTKQLNYSVGNSRKHQHTAITTTQEATVVPIKKQKQRGEGTNPTISHQSGGLKLRTIMQACPEFTFWVRNMGGYLRNWGDLYRSAGDLKKIIGISDHSWLTAQKVMGKQLAAAAIALVFDKHAKGELSASDGYLNGMTAKARAGELHLERSFYGRLRRQAA